MPLKVDSLQNKGIGDTVSVVADSVTMELKIDDEAASKPGFFAKPIREVTAFVSGVWSRLSYHDLTRSLFSMYVDVDPEDVTSVCRVLLAKGGGIPRKIVSDKRCQDEYISFASALLGIPEAQLRAKGQQTVDAVRDTIAASSSSAVPESSSSADVAVPSDTSFTLPADIYGNDADETFY